MEPPQQQLLRVPGHGRTRRSLPELCLHAQRRLRHLGVHKPQLRDLLRKPIRTTQKKSAVLFAALALFENYDLPEGVLDEIRKCVPPQRPAPKKQPRVSREQVMLNLKKRVRREEEELDQRKNCAGNC